MPAKIGRGKNKDGKQNWAGGPAGLPSGLIISWRAAVLIVVLTLLVWGLFWQAQMPLDPGATAIVALASTILVVAGQFLWSRLR